MTTCEVCADKRYLICLRSEDSREAVERCDNCWSGDDAFSDEEAAVLAWADGVVSEAVYPCYVIATTEG